MAGRWSGTIESPGQATRTVSVEFFQAADCVDGAWGTAPSEWAGAISGFAAADSFSGVMSFEGSSSGGRCTATGSASGPVSGNVMTLNWSGPALTGSCAGVLPRSAVVHLQR